MLLSEYINFSKFTNSLLLLSISLLLVNVIVVVSAILHNSGDFGTLLARIVGMLEKNKWSGTAMEMALGTPLVRLSLLLLSGSAEKVGARDNEVGLEKKGNEVECEGDE